LLTIIKKNNIASRAPRQTHEADV